MASVRSKHDLLTHTPMNRPSGLQLAETTGIKVSHGLLWTSLESLNRIGHSAPTPFSEAGAEQVV